MAVLIRTMQEDSYYLFREKFLKGELEFAKVAVNPRCERVKGSRLRRNSHLLMYDKQEVESGLILVCANAEQSAI